MFIYSVDIIFFSVNLIAADYLHKDLLVLFQKINFHICQTWKWESRLKNWIPHQVRNDPDLSGNKFFETAIESLVGSSNLGK